MSLNVYFLVIYQHFILFQIHILNVVLLHNSYSTISGYELIKPNWLIRVLILILLLFHFIFLLLLELLLLLGPLPAIFIIKNLSIYLSTRESLCRDPLFLRAALYSFRTFREGRPKCKSFDAPFIYSCSSSLSSCSISSYDFLLWDSSILSILTSSHFDSAAFLL